MAWLIIAVSSPVAAQPAPVNQLDLARCAQVANAVQRLECYDGLAKKAGVDRPAVETSNHGAWKVSTETSKIDDSKNVYLGLDSNEPIVDRFGRADHRATIIIRCKEGTTAFYVVWGRTFIGSDKTRVTYRLDRDKAEILGVDISSDHYATGLFNSASIPFIRRMFGREQLLMQVQPYSESPITVTFNIGGLQDAIKPLVQACKWPT